MIKIRRCEIGKHEPGRCGGRRSDRARHRHMRGHLPVRVTSASDEWLSLSPAPGDDVDIDVSALVHELGHHGTEEPFLPKRPQRLSDDDLGDVPASRIIQQLFCDTFSTQA